MGEFRGELEMFSGIFMGGYKIGIVGFVVFRFSILFVSGFVWYCFFICGIIIMKIGF